MELPATAQGHHRESVHVHTPHAHVKATLHSLTHSTLSSHESEPNRRLTCLTVSLHETVCVCLPQVHLHSSTFMNTSVKAYVVE